MGALNLRKDADLVRAVADGDRDALAKLYDTYSPTMMATACRMLGDRREAEDVLHDVFLEVWRKAGTYQPHRAKVQTWLLMRLRSRVLDRIRSSGRSRVTFIEDSRHKAPEAISTDDPSKAIDRAMIRKALQALPKEQRTVLELGYFHGLSSSEIANRVNIPVGTVKSRAAAGLAKLRVGLAGEGER